MRCRVLAVLAVLGVLCLPAHAAKTAKPVPPQAGPNKQAAVASIDRQRPELVSLANQVWGFAETALKETRSAKVLADYAEAQGFKVERGVAGMPTAFVA